MVSGRVLREYAGLWNPFLLGMGLMRRGLDELDLMRHGPDELDLMRHEPGWICPLKSWGRGWPRAAASAAGPMSPSFLLSSLEQPLGWGRAGAVLGLDIFVPPLGGWGGGSAIPVLL